MLVENKWMKILEASKIMVRIRPLLALVPRTMNRTRLNSEILRIKKFNGK